VALMTVAFVGLTACGDSTTPTAALSPAPATPSSTTQAAQCTGDPHAHVYSPDRLRLLAACITLTGTIDSETPQADGDYHVRLKLDSGQTCGGQNCLDAKNVSDQAGDLILEPVCDNPITQADAVAACQGYHNPLVLPTVGSHVVVTGPFVLDADHGWNEIHPLESITVVPAPAPSELPSPSPSSASVALSVTVTASTYGFVAATTAPGASCTAKAKLPSGRISTAAGLQATILAGADGTVSWSYGTSSTTKPGIGTHTVTCTLAGKTVSASAAFTVS
jgi:hypothetical protein